MGLKAFGYEYEWKGEKYANYIYAENIDQAKHQLNCENVKEISEVTVYELEKAMMAMRTKAVDVYTHLKALEEALDG